ncbi:LysR family transcriptional regulator [Vibrio paucivorans]
MTNETAQQLSRVDLNLLVTLDVLLREKNVTRAAETLHLSQSALSRALKRLRTTFDDPLFTRVASGLVPTPKALQLETQLRNVLPSLRTIFSEQSFIPKECKLTFSISLPTFISSALMPSLMRRLSCDAPLVNIVEQPAKANPFTAIDQGQIDFAFHYSASNTKRFISQEVGTLFPQLFVRKGHPLTKENQVNIERILQFPLLGMLVEQDQTHSFSAPIQKLYEDFMLKSQPKLRSSQTQILLDRMCESDSVLFGTNTIQALPGFNTNFQLIYTLEHEERYNVALHLVQHERTQHSQAHQWFAGVMLEHLQKALSTHR